MRIAVLLSMLLVANLASATTEVDAIRQAATPCDPARAHCFALRLHVAAPSEGLVVTSEWIARQVATANQHFARLDAGFQIASVDTLPTSAAHVRTRADRSAFGKRLAPRVIDVFVTGKLDDVDEPGNIIYGVTWRKGARKFIILSGEAWERTLAHELGHFFGLPHSTYPISIMNKAKRDEPPPEERTFHDDEYAKMGPVLRRLVRTKVIANVATARR